MKVSFYIIFLEIRLNDPQYSHSKSFIIDKILIKIHFLQSPGNDLHVLSTVFKIQRAADHPNLVQADQYYSL